MAAKKSTKTSTAVAPVEKNTTIATMADMEDVLAKYAKATSDGEKAGGTFISTRAGQFSFGGNPLKGNKLQVIVIDAVYENAYYTGAFDPDSIENPACFAFGRGEDGTVDTMKPHEKSIEPQSEACAKCPMNVFGSAEKGEGKACGNRRRLALVHADGLSAENLNAAQVAYLKLPVTSAKAWAKYVKSVAAQLNRPYFTVVTEVGIVPDPKRQFQLTFAVSEVINDRAMVEALVHRHEAQMPDTTFPYEPRPVTEQKPAKGSAKFKGKASPKRR